MATISKMIKGNIKVRKSAPAKVTMLADNVLRMALEQKRPNMAKAATAVTKIDSCDIRHSLMETPPMLRYFAKGFEARMRQKNIAQG